MDRENPLDKYDFIGIVTAELTPVDKNRFEYYYGNNPNLSSDQYSNVKLTISETLKGSEDKHFFYGRTKKDFSQKNQNGEPQTIFDKLMIKNPNKLANPHEIIKYDEARRIAINRAGEGTTWSSSIDYHKTVDFRDLFDLSIPRLQRPYRNGLCGDESELTIFEGLTYLAFKSGETVIHLEPINPEEDTLVDWVRGELRGLSSDYLEMSFQDIFKSSSSNRYAVIEIAECPSQVSVLNTVKEKLPFLTETRKFKSMSRKNRYGPKLKYAKFDVLVGNVRREDVSLKALEVYMNHIGTESFECQKGKQYFAFARPEDNDDRYAYSGFRSQSDFYNWRFMRVKNEHILLDDFLTNMHVIGSKKLHLSEIIK